MPRRQLKTLLCSQPLDRRLVARVQGVVSFYESLVSGTPDGLRLIIEESTHGDTSSAVCW